MADTESKTGIGPGQWSCTDPSGDLKRMFVDVVQGGRIAQGQSPARRPVFLKPHGVASGTFRVNEDLPEELQVGVFGLRECPVWVRFSSDTIPSASDLKTTCGVAIKLFNVPGRKLLGEGTTQDFILQNHDVFFVDTAKDMCEFTKAGVIGGDYDPYLKSHPLTKQILDDMMKIVPSTLTISYWSVLPYSFGKDRYVKYKLEPEEETEDGVVPTNLPDYLAADLVQRLRKGGVRFRFMVQFQTDQEAMPLDRATVQWSESDSKPIHLATLILPRQDTQAVGQANYGENLSFNPWHCLEEHMPQGSLSEARRVVYEASAENRRNINGVPTTEPKEARPGATTNLSKDSAIVRAAIHPSIGVARLGNSLNEFFIGPEVTEPSSQSPGYYRDQSGALKRQAARFRIYGLNAEGKLVKELTQEDAKIEWSVHLANKKAAWYQFQLALDIPEASAAPPTLLRNHGVSDRSQLSIDPGIRRISGSNQSGDKSHSFDTGRFMGRSVYLGEIQTDDLGRLLVLGGRGKSESFDGSKAVDFANNDGWHDDVSDGPVTAKVSFQGQELKVVPAWVVVAPPNYAPMQKSVRTMWDLMRDVAIQAGLLPKPPRPSFEKDIRPLFERLSSLQWVNAGFAAAFGWNAPHNLADVQWLRRLADPSPTEKELRQTIANHFRVFDRDSWSPTPWPWNYGDAMNLPPPQTPRENTALTDTQLMFLQQWAKGDFEADYDEEKRAPTSIDELPPEEQADMLDRAALEYCLADAFHPGCEMTWPVRNKRMYMSAFRINHWPANWKEPSYGPILISDPQIAPLGSQGPGGLTRWMAVPWQTDTASCLSGYEGEKYDPYLPSFWAAHVPNQVLSDANYKIVMDESRSLADRRAAFANRSDWIGALSSPDYVTQINAMVSKFGELGLVEARPGLEDDEFFPPTMQVESLGLGRGTDREAVQEGSKVDGADIARKRPANAELAQITKVRRFPHGLRASSSS
jgi:hypothetical protein